MCYTHVLCTVVPGSHLCYDKHQDTTRHSHATLRTPHPETWILVTVDLLFSYLSLCLCTCTCKCTFCLPCIAPLRVSISKERDVANNSFRCWPWKSCKSTWNLFRLMAFFVLCAWWGHNVSLLQAYQQEDPRRGARHPSKCYSQVTFSMVLALYPLTHQRKTTHFPPPTIWPGLRPPSLLIVLVWGRDIFSHKQHVRISDPRHRQVPNISELPSREIQQAYSVFSRSQPR